MNPKSRSSDSPWSDDRWWYGRDPDPWGRDEDVVTMARRLFWFRYAEAMMEHDVPLHPALADRLEVEDARRDVEKDG